MRDGFIKIAEATPDLHAADCAYNTSEIVKLAKEAAAKGAKLITFPELCLTGYTCGDLFLQETLLEGALDALNTVCRETAELAAVIVVGLPLRVRGKLYNVAAVVNAGDVLAFVPKTHLPNYSEFYEQLPFCIGRIRCSGGMESVDIKNADGETVCVAAGDGHDLPVRRAAAVHVWCGDLRGPVGAEPAVHRAGAGWRAHYRQPVCLG